MSGYYLAVVVGGAVAGSEAVFQLREKGFTVVCIEQNPLPYGKIEDGLPRWHVEQRKKEYEKIDSKLNHPAVHYVPSTKIGRDIEFNEIYKRWNPSLIVLANGAWNDRPLKIEGIDQYVNKGLIYQNPFVYWFNHYPDFDYRGPIYDVPDNTIVIGGGLASLDVLKICQIELVQKTLKGKGIAADVLEIEKEGVPAFLKSRGLVWEDLKLKGTTLFYRRRVQDMPLAEMPSHVTVDQEAKFGALRAKILNNFQSKYLFNVKACHVPQAPIVEKERLVGLTFVQTHVEGQKAVPVPDSQVDVIANLVIGSIGSVPQLVPGIPAKGEVYDVDARTGEITGMPKAYATGNAVTGKGNIRVSLTHSREVTRIALEKALADPSTLLNDENYKRILAFVRELQEKAAYHGNYAEWASVQRARRMTPS